MVALAKRTANLYGRLCAHGSNAFKQAYRMGGNA